MPSQPTEPYRKKSFQKEQHRRREREMNLLQVTLTSSSWAVEHLSANYSSFLFHHLSSFALSFNIFFPSTTFSFSPNVNLFVSSVCLFLAFVFPTCHQPQQFPGLTPSASKLICNFVTLWLNHFHSKFLSILTHMSRLWRLFQLLLFSEEIIKAITNIFRRGFDFKADLLFHYIPSVHLSLSLTLSLSHSHSLSLPVSLFHSFTLSLSSWGRVILKVV